MVDNWTGTIPERSLVCFDRWDSETVWEENAARCPERAGCAAASRMGGSVLRRRLSTFCTREQSQSKSPCGSWKQQDWKTFLQKPLPSLFWSEAWETMDIIETAKLEEHMENQTGDPANTYTRPAEPAEEEEKNGNGKPKSLSNGLRKGTKKYPDYIQIAVPTDSRNRFPLEWWKTGIAFVYALFNLVLTTVMITVVHERVPPKELSPPLPDKFFDYIDRVTWAFSVSEINGIILVGLWITQWLFLRYK